MTATTLTLAMAIGWSAFSVPADDAPASLPPGAGGISEGAGVPAFESRDDQGRVWKSSDHVGQKIVVLYFYPGDFTGACTRQAQAYRDALEKIEELGAQVVGVSGDEAATHKLFKETYGLKHTLLADPQGKLAELLGVPVKAGGKVWATGPDRRPLLDANKERIEVQRAVTLPRWTFVIGRDGKLRSKETNVDPVNDAAEIVEIVQGLSK